MKKYKYKLAAASLAVALLLCGCAAEPNDIQSGKPTVLCTVFPQYDWVRNIVGDTDGVEVSLLVKNGDMHSFTLSAEDIVGINRCAMLVMNGGESEDQIMKIIENTDLGGKPIFNSMSAPGVGVKHEEAPDGANGHGHKHSEEEAELDEHVWLSLKNAQSICASLADMLAAIDPNNADAYKRNAQQYIEKLKALDDKYADAIGAAPVREVVIADRFPFRYLADDYSLTCYAAFPGCSAETNASFSTIMYLAGKADEISANAIIITDNSNSPVAESVIRNSEIKPDKILNMTSMQAVSESERNDGISYLSVMEDNLAVLREALNR